MNGRPIVIYTAIFGDRDKLVDPEPVRAQCEYVCFTDQPQPSEVWNVQVVEPPHSDPRLSARQYKLLSHLYFPEHDCSLWVDGNITPGEGVEMLTDELLGEHDVATFAHYCRNCLYAEGEHCRRHLRDDGGVIQEQMQRYRAAGYPPNRGLSETGVVLRRHSRATRQLNAAWWAEVCRFSVRDQLSFNYAVWHEEVAHTTLPGPLRRAPWFRYRHHDKER